MNNKSIWVLLFFFFLNVASNLCFCLYDKSIWALTSMVSTGAFISSLEYTFFLACKRWLGKFTEMLTFFILSIVHTTIFAIDLFLIFKFKMLCNQDIIDIIAETSSNEIHNFFSSYLDVETFVILFCLIILLLGIWYISHKLAKYKTKIICFFILLLVTAICVIGRMTYSFVQYRDGLSVPQYIAPLRIIYSCKILHLRKQEISNLRTICANVMATSKTGKKPDVIVVIGESFSKYHCSLYGYEKKTYPLLEKRIANNEIILFSDAVAIADATHKNMKSIFSLAKGEHDFDSAPLFPALFKAAGYKTVLLDNQYIIGKGVNFLTDPRLSTILWDKRNHKNYAYDGEMLEDMNIENSPCLYVIHLMGQHYKYANRYPIDFNLFKEESYSSKYTKKQKEIIAHYDNATIYNDFIINKIISNFEDRDCILLYFSDHGEEVFELSDFMGHGTAINSANPSYQLSVPFIVWMSDPYRKNHPFIVSKINRKKDIPFITSYTSHLLLDVAQIESEFYSDTRDILSQKFDSTKHRIIMNSFDFDNKR